MLLLLLACTDSHGPLVETGPPPTDSLRVATWNVESLGESGSEELSDTRAVLERLDADVYSLNEIDTGQDSTLEELANDMGYTLLLPDDNDFGGIRNAVMTRWDVAGTTIHSSASLYPGAKELTRWAPELRIIGPESGLEVSVLSVHLKSGFDEDDIFRRTIDAVRIGQGSAQAGSRVVVMGDFNAEITDMPDEPGTWTRAPGGLPSSYELGDDLQSRLDGEGILSDPFQPFFDRGLVLLEASQLDGDLGTRPRSGRRIDYVLTTLHSTGAQIFDCMDEHLEGSLPLAGDSVGRGVCEDASDHLPVFADLTLSAE
ncbi:MAG: endonuclease/exonuclease/phosphatase family metal-dependent hydrolase [Cognaticolwellia sp.]|jgi:endonuclease/exonuclease/phosphatase family metal-dependent hydrolase